MEIYNRNAEIIIFMSHATTFLKLFIHSVREGEGVPDIQLAFVLTA